MRKVLYILGLLQDKDIDWLAATGQRVSLTAGTNIVTEGQALDSLYIIVDGGLAVIKQGKELARIGAGEIVGEISMLDSRPPIATVAAAEQSTVLRILRKNLQSKLDIDPGFASRFYKALAIFLAGRMRERDTMGFGKGQALDKDVRAADEIDPDHLENISLAGARFTWLLDRLRKGGPGK